MKVTISHEFDTDPETFWSKLFLDGEFNAALYADGLRFPGYEVLEESDRGNEFVRRVRVTPIQDAPPVVQKLLGGTFAYVEEGTFDRVKKTYRFRVVPSALPDKIRSEGALRAEAAGPKKMRRIVEMSVEVKIFGVGGIVEGFVSKSMQDSYVNAAAFTNRWIAQKGL